MCQILVHRYIQYDAFPFKVQGIQDSVVVTEAQNTMPFRSTDNQEGPLLLYKIDRVHS